MDFPATIHFSQLQYGQIHSFYSPPGSRMGHCHLLEKRGKRSPLTKITLWIGMNTWSSSKWHGFCARTFSLLLRKNSTCCCNCDHFFTGRLRHKLCYIASFFQRTVPENTEDAWCIAQRKGINSPRISLYEHTIRILRLL